jgi:hypothetical protein
MIQKKVCQELPLPINHNSIIQLQCFIPVFYQNSTAFPPLSDLIGLQISKNGVSKSIQKMYFVKIHLHIRDAMK